MCMCKHPHVWRLGQPLSVGSSCLVWDRNPSDWPSASRGSLSPLPSPEGVSGIADSFDAGSVVPGSGHLPRVGSASLTEPSPPTFSSCTVF